MKDTKREFPFYAVYDRTHIERHLEDMAARGWLLEKLENYGWRYRRIEPKTLHFSVCYYPKASTFDPELSDGQMEFADFCAHTGWTLAAANAQLQAFYNERKYPVPIETDPTVELEAIHKTAKKTVLLSYGLTLGVALLLTVTQFSTLFTDPVGWLSRSSSLISGCMILLLLLMCAVELGGYYLWRECAKRAAEQGEFYPTPDLSGFEKVCLALALLLLALEISSVVFSGSRLLRWVTGALFAYIALMMAAVNGTKALLKRKKVSASVNRAATIGVDIALGLVMFAALMFFVFRVADLNDGMTDAAIPLTTEDLTGEDYPEEWYFRSVSEDRSPLLVRYTARQYASTHHIDAKEYHDLPGMDYTVTDVKAAFLFDLCKNHLLHAGEKPRGNDPEGYLVEFYEPVDAAPWGAQEAYRLHWHPERDPLDRWLLVYGNHLVEINLDWEPTAEQMAIVGEKLGK